MMRRLPVFFLVDVSESMVGENLYKVEEGIATVLTTLRKDPYALELTFLSVIAFAGRVKTICPLTELISFYPPELPVGGGTALGHALQHLMNEIDRNVVTTTSDFKGDWKPIVFLLTDGHPTDDVSKSVERWNHHYRNRTNLIAVSIGGGSDHAILERLTDDVIVFNEKAKNAFDRFVMWISMSIQSHSRSVSAGQDGRVNLAKVEPDLLASVDSAEGIISSLDVDDRYAVFVGKCSANKQPYVVKYERRMGQIETQDPELSGLLQTRHYVLSAAVPVKNSYFDYSDDVRSGTSVSSEELVGQPGCPHCNAPYGMAVCSCGGIHCVSGEGECVCPWCGNIALYGAAADGDSFEIGRGRG